MGEGRLWLICVCSRGRVSRPAWAAVCGSQGSRVFAGSSLGLGLALAPPLGGVWVYPCFALIIHPWVYLRQANNFGRFQPVFMGIPTISELFKHIYTDCIIYGYTYIKLFVKHDQGIEPPHNLIAYNRILRPFLRPSFRAISDLLCMASNLRCVGFWLVGIPRYTPHPDLRSCAIFYFNLTRFKGSENMANHTESVTFRLFCDVQHHPFSGN